ncbi:MAG: apolipoprotein N-acyltransferase [Burkholderiales bacterium]
MIGLILIILAGGLHSLPMAYPVLWVFQPLALACLLWQLDRASPRRAAALAWLFGLAWLTASVWWLFVSMHTYGGLPAWMSVAAVWALCAALAGYLALAFAAFAKWRTRRLIPDSVLVSALWLLAELARGMMFTGFPWASSGYAHVDSPLAGLAPWLGVYGMGAAATFFVALLVFQRALSLSIRSRGVAIGSVLAVVLGVAQFLDHDFTSAVGELSVALLQNNVPQNEKFQAQSVAGQLDWTLERLTSLPVELVVAPETVVPLLPADIPQAFHDAVVQHYQQPGRHALIGLPLGDERIGYTNSVAGLSALMSQKPPGFYRYDKHHLVPFGEFIPPAFRWFTQMMNIPLGDFDRGPLVAPSFPVQTGHTVQWVAPHICYEDLFGEELAARFITDHPPTMLANLSNIAWFGNTIAIRQHLQISRLRSLELQRPILRSTNTGATAIINHRGQVVNQLPPHTQAVLGGLVQGRQGLTPFAWWAGRWGLWPLLGVALVLIALSRRGAP